MNAPDLERAGVPEGLLDGDEPEAADRAALPVADLDPDPGAAVAAQDVRITRRQSR